MYYLNSRYYSSEWQRFINADILISNGESPLRHNMYAYCLNNPIMIKDPSGELGIVGVAILVGAVVATVEMQKMLDSKKGPTWAGLGAALNKGMNTAAAIVTFYQAAIMLYDAASYVYNNIQYSKAPPLNNNSLATTKPAIGYSLTSKQTGQILKYGETTNFVGRYSQKFLNNMVPGGAQMNPLAYGSKYEMHYWQHDMIIDYANSNPKCEFPPFNKNGW